MPAKDIYHNAVKNALLKDGWKITADPYLIKYEDAELYADLAAEKPIAAEKKGQKIVVKIKSFVGRSLMYDFHSALGQYMVYRKLTLSITDATTINNFASENVHFSNNFSTIKDINGDSKLINNTGRVKEYNRILDEMYGEPRIPSPNGDKLGECVSFVKSFTKEFGVEMKQMGGNGGAKYGFENFGQKNYSLPSDKAEKITYTNIEKPQVGDIIFFDEVYIYDKNGKSIFENKYGHVAVVQSVLDNDRVIIQESNRNGKAPNTSVTRDEINLKQPDRYLGKVMGCLRLN
jgi:surface antigen